MGAAVVHRISVFPLTIPLPQPLLHDRSAFEAAEPVMIATELTNGLVGYGETLPGRDPTGESVKSVIEAVRTLFAPFLVEFHPDSFPEALEAIESLPWHDGEGRLVQGARAAVELALLDTMMHRFDRDIDDVVQWMGLPGFGSPGSIPLMKYSGLLAEESVTSTRRRLRRMYWRGVRHFKLDVGAMDGRKRLEWVASYLKRPLTKGHVTLRLDARGQWSKDEAIEWLGTATDIPIACVEQPLARGSEEDLPILHDLFDVLLMHDESLVTIEDGQRLIDLGVADGFNIGINKCGGLLPALRLAALARRSDVRVQLGCAVGQTSILSAAGRRFLQVCPGVEWAEGCPNPLGRTRDLTAESLRFSYGARPPRLQRGGLGVKINTQRLLRLCDGRPLVINL